MVAPGKKQTNMKISLMMLLATRLVVALKWNETILRLTLFVTVSLVGVTGVTLGVVLMVVRGGREEVKLNVGKAEVLMGSEMVGRSGISAT